MMAELNPVPFGRCRGRWRERKHRTVPTIGKSARRLFVPVRFCHSCCYNKPRAHSATVLRHTPALALLMHLRLRAACLRATGFCGHRSALARRLTVTANALFRGQESADGLSLGLRAARLEALRDLRGEDGAYGDGAPEVGTNSI